MPRLLAIIATMVMSPLAALAQSRAAPEAATGFSFTADPPATTEQTMVVTAHPLATLAARRILRDGGSAADAAIAAQLVLGLVEPQSSGLGGGAFALYWDQDTKQLTSIDGRETAPAAATPERFLGDNSTPNKWSSMVPGGLSVGTPGTVALLAKLHEDHGTVPWSRLFEDALGLARDGFGVSGRLSALLQKMGPDAFSPAARDYFFNDDGEAHPLGHVLKNPTYAVTLQTLAVEGPDGFYRGAVAQGIVDAVAKAWINPGDLTGDDLAAYVAKPRDPVCIGYRTYKVCGMGPPSSGGLTVGMALAMLQAHDLGTEPNAMALHLIAEAEKLAFADRNAYIADTDYVTMPHGLLDPAYLDERARLIDPAKAMEKAAPGTPPGADKAGADATKEAPGTSQISIIDGNGNALSMTTTIESAFGSRLMSGGFLLNNELTDFSFKPVDAAGKTIANRIQGGKRPRSSMAPTIIFDDKGAVYAALGSPGGSRIIPYVIKAIVALIDWQLDPQAAATFANFGSRNGPFEIEPGAIAETVKPALTALGHEIRESAMTSGLNIIVRDQGLYGGTDPRREGFVAGD